jgi:hypothetical protein
MHTFQIKYLLRVLYLDMFSSEFKDLVISKCVNVS